MKLFGVTTTYNNEKMVPYVMKYAEWLGYDKLVVYDNGSTDNTVELLKKYPFVEVKTYETEHFCEREKMHVKMVEVFNLQQELGNSDYAWATTCDFDEVYYYADGLIGDTNSKSHFLDYLLYLTLMGYNVCTENFVGVVSREPNYNEDIFVHKQADKVAYQCPFLWNKPNLFRMDNLKKIYYAPGQHYGNLEFLDQEPKQFFNTKSLFAFHLKFAFGKQYVIDITKMYNKRGCQGKQEEEPKILYKESFIANSFEEAWWIGVSPQDYFKHKWLNGDDSYEHLPPKQYY